MQAWLYGFFGISCDFVLNNRDSKLNISIITYIMMIIHIFILAVMIVRSVSFIHTFYCFMFFLILTNRKHCSWNTPPEVLPWMRWLCDITLRHHVTNLHHLWQDSGLFDSAQPLSCCLWCWVRCVWAGQWEKTWYSGWVALKRQELKQHLRLRVLQYWTEREKNNVFFEH